MQPGGVIQRSDREKPGAKRGAVRVKLCEDVFVWRHGLRLIKA